MTRDTITLPNVETRLTTPSSEVPSLVLGIDPGVTCAVACVDTTTDKAIQADAMTAVSTAIE